MGRTKPVAWMILAVLLATNVTVRNLVASTPAELNEVLQVSTSSELIAALAPQSQARNIHLQAGDYAIDQPLYVPDGVALSGAGVMRMENGLPAEFNRAPRQPFGHQAGLKVIC